MKKLLIPALVTATALLAATAQNQPGRTATAELKDAQGNVVGTATLTEDGPVTVKVELKGFTAARPGEHGIHIHAVGSCQPTFAAAGGHFNPGKNKHGLLSTDGRHAGDLPNIVVTEGGNATYMVKTQLVSLAEGRANTLFDADGSAIVIHAGADDHISDPAGDSGDRIACGVLQLK